MISPGISGFYFYKLKICTKSDLLMMYFQHMMRMYKCMSTIIANFIPQFVILS